MKRWAMVTLWLALALLVAGAAQTENQAALVVSFGDDRVETYCVAFADGEITGRELLERSGLALEFEEVGIGASLCSVEEVGCPGSNCFCECRGGVCEYWSYWRLRDDEWRYSSSGASITPVRHGDVEGWSWGPGSVSEAPSPPEITFEDVCAAAVSPVSEAPQTSVEAGNQLTPEVMFTATPATEALEEETRPVPVSYLVFGLLILLLAVLGVAVSRRRRA